MTTNVGYATISIIPSLTGFQRNLDRGVTPGLSSAGKSAGKRFGSSFGSALRGTIAGLGIFQAGSAALRFFGDSVAEGRESIRIGKQTAAVIKSTGGAARVSERHVGRYANTLARMAGIDDETIQGGQNVLLTFKNIANQQGANNKIFDKATKAALDLSVAMGKSLNSSALQVGKALNDPLVGMTALTRAGVQFSAQQKDQIKTAVSNGNVLRAQKIELRELTSEFAGSARAQATEAGKLSVSWGNFKEEIGTALIPVLDRLAKFLRTKGIPAARDFFHFLETDGVPAAKKVGRFAGVRAGQVKGLVDAFRGMPAWVQKILIAGGVGAVAAKKLGAFKLVGSTGLLSKGGTPLNPLFVSVVGGLPGGTPGAPGVLSKSLLIKAGTVTLQGALVTAFAIEIAEIIKHERAIAPNTVTSFAIGPHVTGDPSAADKKGDPNFFSDKLNAELAAQAKAVGGVRTTWLHTKEAVEDYSRFVQQRVPREIHTTVTGWDVANKQAADYLAKLLLIRSTRLDINGEGLGGATPPNRSGGGSKGGGGPTDRVIAVNTTYNVNTIGDAQRHNLHKQQQVSMGGFG